MYTNFEKNNLKLKLLNNSSFNFCKSINININLFKLNTINDSQLSESLILLESFTALKSFISYFKKNFKEISIQIANDLNIKNFWYFFSLLKIFYLPVLRRRNISLENEKTFFYNWNFNYTINNINILPFLPDIYFRWNRPINCFFNLKNTSNKKYIVDAKYLENITGKKNLLHLYYLGFNFITSLNK